VIVCLRIVVVPDDDVGGGSTADRLPQEVIS